MKEYYPLLILGAIIGAFSLIFTLAYVFMKNKKEAIGFERNIKDGEIVKRLLVYARPHLKSFLLVGFIMLVSISYDIISPLLIGKIEKLLTEQFEMARLLAYVGVYAGILIVSLVFFHINTAAVIHLRFIINIHEYHRACRTFQTAYVFHSGIIAELFIVSY